MRVWLFTFISLLCIPAFAAEPTSAQRLNLRAPDIHDVLTPQQISSVIAATHDPDQDSETVQVQGFRGTSAPRTPVAWSGLAAPFWALLHPANAWRIFAPLPPDQARPVQVADQPYLAVAAQNSELRAGL
ncbi:MAG TPA: hypothetical protein VFS47_10960 [Steroidobacteraceae bacterium]|nr:hypothetical protein [Steroidobacteraceae bacterium]